MEGLSSMQLLIRRILSVPYWTGFMVRLVALATALHGSLSISASPGPLKKSFVGDPGAQSREVETEVDALLGQARQSAQDGDPFTAGKIAAKIAELRPAQARIRIEAGLMQIRADSLYGQSEAWRRVQSVCEALLQEPAIRHEERFESAHAAVTACRALWAMAEMEAHLRVLLSMPLIAFQSRIQPELDLARLLFGQGSWNEALKILDGMIGLLVCRDFGFGRPQLGEWMAEARLIRGLCLERLGRQVEARLELDAATRVTGLREDSPAARGARLRLAQLGWWNSGRRVLRVLFVGSSHTLMGNVPFLLERIAQSAGPDSPEIVAGEQARMGTGMRLHWLAGEGPDTARRRILREGPWDVIVVEAFYRHSLEELLEFGGRYRELADQVGSRLVVFGTPVSRELDYPEGWRQVHENQRQMVGVLRCGWAPGVLSMMQILGKKPGPADLNSLYKDWIHSTGRGAYLSACALYSALSGKSAEGLYAPREDFEFGTERSFQRAAWIAYLDSLQTVSGKSWSSR